MGYTAWNVILTYLYYKLKYDRDIFKAFGYKPSYKSWHNNHLVSQGGHNIVA